MPNYNIETDDDQQLMIIPRSKRSLKRHHLRMFQDNLLILARDKELTQTDLKVLLGLLGHVEFDNKIQISQLDLAEMSGIKQSNISASIKKLCSKKIIIETGKIGRQKIYHLHPDYGFKARANRLGSLVKAIDNGNAPGQRSFAVEDVIFEERPLTSLEEMSKALDLPVSKVAQVLEMLVGENGPDLPNNKVEQVVDMLIEENGPHSESEDSE